MLGTDGLVRHQAEIEVTGSPMIHDCALTEHYLVVYDLPVTFDLAMVAGEAPRPVTDRLIDHTLQVVGTDRVLPYSWDADYPGSDRAPPREGTSADVRWFEIDPCYIFHTLNAYEEGADVVIDVVRHDRMFATEFSTGRTRARHTSPASSSTRSQARCASTASTSTARSSPGTTSG